MLKKLDKNGNPKWAIKYKRCIKCRTTKIPHHSKGLCYNCFQQKMNKRYKEYRKEYYKKYWLKHKEELSKKYKKRYYKLKKQ